MLKMFTVHTKIHLRIGHGCDQNINMNNKNNQLKWVIMYYIFSFFFTGRTFYPVDIWAYYTGPHRCNSLRCPLARLSGLQCFNMGHNGHGINLYGVIMTLMEN